MSEPLSDDEQAVLSIAAHGEYMAPIGRWEKSIKSLHAKGLMHRYDDFNYAITDAGRKAQAQEEQSRDAAVTDALAAVGRNLRALETVQADIQRLIEAAAQGLAESAKLSAQATGNSVESELVNWGRVLLERSKVLAQL